MKQAMKRVSAALLAVLMVLSLLPQTALALDPDQRQAERREGYDVATVHYTDAEGNEQAIPFTETGSGYVYTLPQGVTEDKVTVEYFSTTRWDGAVDISWYNDTDKEFTLTTPAQLAGLAALVAGQTSAETSRWRVKGDVSRLVCEKKEDFPLVGAGGGNVKGTVYLGTAQYDFADKVVKLGCDMDMGGVNAGGTWSGPNWTPIGGRYAMDITVADEADEAKALLSQSYFNGTLDGQGHRIVNLYCDRYSPVGFGYSQGVGLIGYMGQLYDGETAPAAAPTVRNLSVSGSVYARRSVAGIVGRVGEIATGVHVENCANYADILATDSKGMGGIVGAGWGTGYIVNCYNTGKVVNEKYPCPAGGICGNNDGMDIYACYNVGTIQSQDGRGRGIGGHDSGTYTVANCYYLEGCDNDPDSNGWYKGANTTCTIEVTKMTQAQMQSRELTDKLNANGGAFVYREGQYPVLFWEAEGYSGSDHQVTVQSTQAITVSASAQGAVRDGSVVYLSYTETPGSVFRYFTANGRQIRGDYYTVTEDVTFSAAAETMQPGTLLIPESDVYTMTVTKTGVVYENGEAKNVTDHPVKNGDPIYENDVLTAKAELKDGAAPDNPDNYYTGAFDYTFAYQEDGGASKTNRTGSFTATASQAPLKLTAEGITARKVWTLAADTGWYNDTDTEFTLTTAQQLAGLAKLTKEGNSFQGKTIRLGADISLLRYEDAGKPWWNGIGNTVYSNPFSGTFDGCGHTIDQMQAGSLGSGAGLFLATDGAVIENLTVIGSAEALGNMGGIVSVAIDTTIRNCVSRVDISSTYSTTKSGGIVGFLRGSSVVENCVNYGSLSDGVPLGGIAGEVEKGCTVRDCVNFGAVNGVTGTGGGLGGVVGKNNGGTLLRCANYGRVTAVGGSWYTGGVAGLSYGPVTDCYNVADVTGGHTRYSNGGIGGILGGHASGSQVVNSYNYGKVALGQDMVCDNLGGVIGKDWKRSDAKVQNAYYLDSSCAFAVMNGEYENVTAVSAADFAGESFLRKLNADGCFILRNHKYPELEMAADLVGGDPVLTVTIKDAQGNVTGEQRFTARQLGGMASTTVAGYQYWKKGTENLVAATKYVTVDTLLKAVGAEFTPGMTVTAADATGFGSTLSYQDYQDCRWFVDGDGNKSDAPAALALAWNSGEGTLEQVAAGAVDTGSIRFCYGISESQYGNAAGKRLVSGVVTVTVQACVHAKTEDVAEIPATCTEPGVTAGVKCTVCGTVVSGCETIPAKGHTEVEIPAVEPTETEGGWTAGVKCAVCGVVLVEPQPIPPLTAVLTVSGLDADGKTVTKGYTLPALKALAETEPLGYQYKLKRFTYTVAAVEYVRLDRLMADAGIVYGAGSVVTAGNGSGTSALGYQESLTLNNGVNADGAATVPVVLALRWGENRFSFADAVTNANSAGGKTTLRFCYGIGQELTAEDRLLDKVTTLDVTACAHTGATQPVTGTPATCTEPGLTDGQLCLICGKVLSQETIPALGHDFDEWTVVKAATCTESGTESRTCARCQETETRTVEALGHTPELRNAKEASCTEDGYTGDMFCKTCGQLLAKGQAIPAPGHDFRDGKCAVCGAADPDYKPGEPVQPGVKTGDGSHVMLWSAVLLTSAAAVVLLPRKKRS